MHKKKLKEKGCDWLIANEVGLDENGVEKTFGSDQNCIYVLDNQDIEKWPRLDKTDIGLKLVERIINNLVPDEQKQNHYKS